MSFLCTLFIMSEEKKATVPARRWTRPGFFEKIFKPGKNKDYFYFENLPEPLSPLILNLDDVHLKWEDGFWVNLGTDYHPELLNLDAKQEKDMIQENRILNAQIEILLDMNTNYELKKAHLREKLALLENQIRHFPGLDLDSGEF